MDEIEVKEFVLKAVEHTENSSDDLTELKKARTNLALWLWHKFKIAIKQMVINADDGMPYLRVEFDNEQGEKVETHISLEKYKERMAALISSGEEN